MKTVNYTELRDNLKKNLEAVSDNEDLLVVHRPKGKSIVMMSLNEFNALQETLHLTRSDANRKRLDTAVENINALINLEQHNLID